MNNNVASEVKLLLDLERTCLDGYGTNRVRVRRYFQDLIIKTDTFAFEVKVIQDR